MKKQEKKINCAIKTSIGGQALMEGIMMRGPKRSAMAVRNPRGEIVIEEWDTKISNRSKILKLPIIRGVFSFADSMISGYKCLMRSAEISGLEELEEEERRAKAAKKAAKAAKKAAKRGEPVPEIVEEAEPSKADDGKKKKSSLTTVIMIVAVVLALVLVVGLFIWLPTFLYTQLGKIVPFMTPENRFLKSVFEGVLKVMILVGYMAAVSRMKEIKRTFMYHGAEHKTIFCYEQGLELTVENVRKQKRFHPRCGTSFLILMVLVGILIALCIPPTLDTWLRTIVKIALLPITMGVGYELIKITGKHDNVITRIISAPGMWLQRITTVEPDDDMIECAIIAIEKVIPDDGSDKLN